MIGFFQSETGGAQLIDWPPGRVGSLGPTNEQHVLPKNDKQTWYCNKILHLKRVRPFRRQHWSDEEELLSMELNVLLLVMALPALATAETVSITTKLGSVSGVVKTSVPNGIDFAAFMSIPYAQAPKQELRFQPPKPVTSWPDGHIDGSQAPPMVQCMTTVRTYSARLIIFSVPKFQ